MQKITCNVVKDLLPLYVDEVLSSDSRKVVEEHLDDCSECRKYHDNIKENYKASNEKPNHDKEVIKRISRKIFTKRMIAVFTAIILISAVFIGIYYGVFVRERYLSYEDSGIYVENDMIKTNRNHHCLHDNQNITEDGLVAFVYLSTTVYQDSRPQGETAELTDLRKQNMAVFKDGGNSVEEYKVKKAYYVPQEFASKIRDNYLAFASEEDIKDIMDASVLIWEYKE